MQNSYSYYCNMACQYFPYHKGLEGEDFNCLFCYCPLYALGDSCGGDFSHLKNGIKDCSACLFPHRPENYEEIVRRFGEIAALAKKRE